MSYIASILEFYDSLRNSSSKEVFELMHQLKKNPSGILIFSIESYDKEGDSKKIFQEMDEDLYRNLERIARGNYARETGRAFESLFEVPSKGKHRHEFYEVGAFCDDPLNPGEDLISNSLIYQCEECKLHVYDCPECGIIKLATTNLESFIVEALLKRRDAGNQCSNPRYICSNCKIDLGDNIVLFEGARVI